VKLQEYDVALKLLLRVPGLLALRDLAGTPIETWVDAGCQRFRISGLTCSAKPPMEA
jgi:hypothetical protein